MIKDTVNNSGKIFSSQIISLILIILQVGIVTKSLGLELYGKLSIILVLTSLIFRILLSKNSDVVIFYLNKYKQNQFLNSLYFDFLLGLIGLIISIILLSFGSFVFNISLNFSVYFYLLTRILLHCEETFKGYFTYYKNFKKLAYLKFIQDILNFVLIVLFFQFEKSIDSYLNALSSATLLYFLIGIVLSKEYIVFARKNFIEFLKSIKQIFFKQRLNQLTGIVPQHFDLLILGYFSTYSEVGIYRLAKRLVDPINIIVNSLNPVIQNKIFNSKDSINIQEFTKKITIPISVILIFAYIIFGNSLISIVSSIEFIDSYTPMLIILMGQIIYLNFFWIRNFLLFQNRIQYHTIARMVGTIVFLIFSIFLSNSFRAVGISIAFLIANLTQKIFEYYFYKKNQEYSN